MFTNPLFIDKQMIKEHKYHNSMLLLSLNPLIAFDTNYRKKIFLIHTVAKF